MNVHIKVAFIIGAAILVAMAMSIYFSPFHTCLRSLENKDGKAALYCANAAAGGR